MMKKRKREHNIYTYLLLKLLLAFGTLLAMQAAFYLANTRIFHIDGWSEWRGLLLGNLVFGLATVGTFLMPYVLMILLPFEARRQRWYRAVAEGLYIVPVLLMLIPRGANMAYYQYTYRLLSDEIFSYLGISGQMGSLLPHFAVDYWYAWAVPLCLAVLFLVVNGRLHMTLGSKQRYLGIDLMGLLAGMAVMWLMARGGIGHRLQPADAARFAQPKNTALVSNDAYHIARTLFSPDIEEVHTFSQAEADALFPAMHRPWNGLTDSTLHGRNVVLLIVESLGQEFMGCYNTQPGAETRTPFLDSLARHSTLYDGRSNGKKSIEGITAITTSVPNLMYTPLTNSPYRDDHLVGLPTVLKRHGYHCAFFHGSYNGEMGFDSTCFRLGFDEYLGKNEYEADPMARPGDYDGVWGIFDEPFLQFTAKHIGTFEQPFLAEIFTVTSHHPFPLPDSHKGQFAEGSHPILKCVEYTDYSVRRFFEQAQKQPWYSNTLFVITGDHSGHGLTPEYNDYDGWYRIPVMIFDPQRPEGQRSLRIVQHVDLFPTLVDMLGYGNEEFVSFGTSAVQQPRLGWQVYFGNGYHVLVSNNAAAPEQHDITVLMGDQAIGSQPGQRMLQAIIQQYNNRVINDRLTKVKEKTEAMIDRGR